MIVAENGVQTVNFAKAINQLYAHLPSQGTRSTHITNINNIVENNDVAFYLFLLN